MEPVAECRQAVDRYLKLAGIPKRDERGRIVSFHALRHMFGTHLQAAGIPMTHAQQLLRHRAPKLTANIYGHADLYPPLAAAVERLPSFGGLLGVEPQSEGDSARLNDTRSQTPTKQKPPENVDFPRVSEVSSQERVKGVEPSTFTLAT